jgi:hypothetical protein
MIDRGLFQIILLLIVVLQPCLTFQALQSPRKKLYVFSKCKIIHNEDGQILDSTITTRYDDTCDDDDIALDNSMQQRGDFANFNPFKYNAATSSPLLSTNSNDDSIFGAAYTLQTTTTPQYNERIISLRQTRMQQLLSDLLATGGNHKEMQKILQDNREFILEPLDDDGCVYDDDMAKLYAGCQSRAQRYRAYEESISKRIEIARNSEVKRLLTVMKDFVLSGEQSQSQQPLSSSTK